jgi:hypothetical protein
MSNLTNILDDIDINEIKKDTKDNSKTIDLVLEEIKENDRCEDFISKLKKLNISSPKNEVKVEDKVDEKKEEVKVEDKVEEKKEEVKVEIKVEEKKEEVEVKVEEKKEEVEIKVEEKKDEVKKNELKNDGICRAKVATTKVRCTAPCKIGMLCGRHKNYTGKLME